MVRKEPISFSEWSNGKTFPKKKNKGAKNVATSNQGSSEIGNFNNKGEAVGSHSKIVSNDFQLFPIIQ